MFAVMIADFIGLLIVLYWTVNNSVCPVINCTAESLQIAHTDA